MKPSCISHGEVLRFVGDTWANHITHIRIVTTEHMSNDLMLLKFRDWDMARDFRKEYNGKRFNDRVADTCDVAFVKSIEFQSTAQPTETLPPASSSSNLRPFPPPPPGLPDIPICPVCLERMDDSSGLITIACQHIFHSTCLQKWQDGGCPVCRFASVVDDSIPGAQPFGQGVSNLCSVCDCTSDLWICLICGHVGCGRYKGAHAKDHWKDTAHNFALEIETQYVWDYGDDKWVHRFIREKGNGKLVELPERHLSRPGQNSADQDDQDNSHDDKHHRDAVPLEKYEAMSAEYTQLLVNQLESQRIYYEDIVSKTMDKADKATEHAESSKAMAQTLTSDNENLKAAVEELKKDMARLTRSVDQETARAAKAQDLARSLGKALQEEKEVNKGLMQRIQHVTTKKETYEEQLQALKTEVAGLQEMNHDLTMFISGQEKLREMENEGTIRREEIEGASTSAPVKKNRRRKN
ncbi:RING finger protein ETP1 -like protein [Ceratocystis fimbriata CBS 114723]|uniref:RING finger protein ETP1-like protein n=1 Tax=Ceratocystis fimbriata CBS 114723 TaxID=1035309 RepID=A0A2C5X449_9PEZI|nr:RING finger protein ETP1 -like protein [Ceratocystis fimbriata CBS 114723]